MPPRPFAGALSEVALLAHSRTCSGPSSDDSRDVRPRASAMRADAKSMPGRLFRRPRRLPGGRAAGLPARTTSVEVVSTLGRYGQTMLEAEHLLLPCGSCPSPSPRRCRRACACGCRTCWSPSAKGRTTCASPRPANARLDAMPGATDAARVVSPGPRSPGARHVLRAAHRGRARCGRTSRSSRRFPSIPDRDLNGVGPLYFANYVGLPGRRGTDRAGGRGGFAAERARRPRDAAPADRVLRQRSPVG